MTFPPACPPLDVNTQAKDGAVLPAYSTTDLMNEEFDPWDLPELKDTGVKWSGEAAPHSPSTAHNFVGDLTDPVLCLAPQSWTQKER